MSTVELAQSVMARNPSIATLASEGRRSECREAIHAILYGEDGPAGWVPKQPKERSSRDYRITMRAFVRMERRMA